MNRALLSESVRTHQTSWPEYRTTFVDASREKAYAKVGTNLGGLPICWPGTANAARSILAKQLRMVRREKKTTNERRTAGYLGRAIALWGRTSTQFFRA